MKVIIAGNSGMVGDLVLTNCLNSILVSEVVSLVRKPSNIKHEKLNEVIITNFEDYSEQEHLFKNVKAAFFCIGVYTGQVPDKLFKTITVDYAVEFALALEKQSPNARLCLLSGQGADRTEQSKTSFAKYKGMAENRLAKLNLEFYSFRPGYIYPVESRKEPNVGYTIMRKLYPLIRLFGNKYSITSEELAGAMYYVGMNGAEKQVLENNDILTVK